MILRVASTLLMPGKLMSSTAIGWSSSAARPEGLFTGGGPACRCAPAPTPSASSADSQVLGENARSFRERTYFDP